MLVASLYIVVMMIVVKNVKEIEWRFNVGSIGPREDVVAAPDMTVDAPDYVTGSSWSLWEGVVLPSPDPTGDHRMNPPVLRFV